VLGALDTVAARHRAPVAAVALAWLTAQPTVAAAVASARTTAQLRDLLAAGTLELGSDDLGLLDDASGKAAL
jgi:aryl-alcohol dehydrogenase-like predicted oxidoreductase